MQKILSIDTSTELSSVALLIGDSTHNCQIQELTSFGTAHSKSILNSIQIILKDNKLKIADLDAIAYGQGPGSFTGLRVAASVVQGLAYANKLQVLPVSTLRALANSMTDRFVLSILDARMQEVYWGLYKQDKQVISSDKLSSLVNVDYQMIKSCIINEQLSIVGTGVKPYLDELTENLNKFNIRYELYSDPILYPKAEEIAKCALADFLQGSFIKNIMAVPYYIRDDVVKKSTKRA